MIFLEIQNMRIRMVFINPVTFVLGKFFRSIAMMLHLVGVTTNCDKIL